MDKKHYNDGDTPVKVIRNKQEITVPFKQIIDGDVVLTKDEQTRFVAMYNAWYCNAPGNESWMVLDTNGDGHYPYEFEIK